MLFELQQWTTTQVHNQVHPGNTFWSPNFDAVTCQGHNLNMARFQAGIPAMFKRAWELYLGITKGRKFVTKDPSTVSDDMTNTTRGYSFLDHGPFTDEPDACMVFLLSESDWKFAMVDSNNRLAWNLPAIVNFLNATAELNQILSVLTFILPTISVRVSQFLGSKFANHSRQRTLMMIMGEMVNLTVYHKMTNQTGYDLCVPSFFPKALTEIMFEYLGGGLRHCEAFFSKFVYGEQARSDYSS